MTLSPILAPYLIFSVDLSVEKKSSNDWALKLKTLMAITANDKIFFISIICFIVNLLSLLQSANLLHFFNNRLWFVKKINRSAF